MNLHEQYGLTPVINAWGTATVYGVSRVPKPVVEQVALAMGEYVDMEELEHRAGEEIARHSGAPWGCVTHCTAAAITLATAACMTGRDRAAINRLPDSTGLPDRVLIQAGHCVNYGHEITQAVRLAGARSEVVGSVNQCDPGVLADKLAEADVAAVLVVDSHLTVRHGMVALEDIVALAHAAGKPVIVDAAAQDLRLRELVTTGADLILVSAQKYLRAPTAGLVAGRRDLVEALAMQHRGIGRAMKPSKEGIIGVLAALAYRQSEPRADWIKLRVDRVARTLRGLKGLENLEVTAVPDPTGCPFERVRIRPIPTASPLDAPALASALAAGTPKVAVGAHYADLGYLNLEVNELDNEEIDQLVARLTHLLKDDSEG